MKTKIVYCLVSDNDDFYLEQLLMSLYSLKIYNSDSEVFLVVDEKTSDTLTDKRAKVFEYVSNVIRVTSPSEYSKVLRSRYLKTNLRNYIEGDYLYIDTDTVICDCLEDIDNCGFEIGAVLDNHQGRILEDQLKKLPEDHKWNSLKGTTHYNSGVFYVKDTPNTHAFYKTWHEYWQEGITIGSFFDQLPLRKTVLDFGKTFVSELNGVWNCQVFRSDSKPYWNDSKIIHFQGIAKDVYFPITLPRVCEEIKIKGDIPSEIKKMLRDKKDNLLKKKVIVYGKNLDYYESPMHDVYFDYPRLFSLFITMANMYRVVKNAKITLNNLFSR